MTNIIPIPAESCNIGFIGAGKMAESIAKGVVRSGLLPASQIRIAHLGTARCTAFESFGVQVLEQNTQVVKDSDVVIFSVKPQVVKDVVLQLRPLLSEKQLLVSVVAGVKLKDLQEWAGHSRFIRVMPNTPAAVGLAASAMADLSLRRTAVEEKRAKVQQESKEHLDYTRKAIARLTYLKRTLAQLEDDIPPCEAQMEHWKTNLVIMESKERQYLQQYSNYKAMLNRAGYSPEISHGVLVEMAEHRKDLEKKTKPILDTLRSYQDLPPDKALAALAIEDKRRQYAAAEKYLEDVLQSALASSE